MDKMPGALFIIDPKKEETAVREAYRLKIPIIALIDTNCDPDLIDYPIPGNDDAIRSVKLICEVVSSAVKEGRDQFKQIAAAEEMARIEEAREAAAEYVRAEGGGEEDEIVEQIEEKVVGKLDVVEAEKIRPKKAKTLKEEE